MSGWHKFDFTVVLLALPDLLEAVGLDANLSSVFPTNLLRILRIARVARVLRLIKSSKGLQSLLTALLLSLPAMANLSGIFLIVQFLYAVLGMQLFGKVRTTHYSLLTYALPLVLLAPCSLLLATCYLLIATHYSLLTTHYSLLTTHYSLLTTHYSLLTHYLPD